MTNQRALPLWALVAMRLMNAAAHSDSWCAAEVLYHFDQKFVTRHAQRNRTSVLMYNPAIGEGSLAKIQKSRTIGRNTTV
jgi:hypothetical protein